VITMVIVQLTCRVRGDRFERLIDRDRLIAADYRFMDIAAARGGPRY